MRVEVQVIFRNQQGEKMRKNQRSPPEGGLDAKEVIYHCNESGIAESQSGDL